MFFTKVSKIIYNCINIHNILCILNKNKLSIKNSPGFNNIYEEIKYLIIFSIYKNYIINNNRLFKKLEKKDKFIILKYLKKRIIYKIPTYYITNKIYYYNILLYINKDAIIPRSSIGEIIKNTSILNKILKKKIKNVLDLCTGSGCISILFYKNYNNKKIIIHASDISNKALRIAKININKYNLYNNIKLIKSNLFSKIENKYDLIITNPPYLNKNNMENITHEYKYEPYISKYGGYNGLKYIDCIIKQSFNYLNNNGVLICEVGDNYKNVIKKYSYIKFKWVKVKNKNNKIFFLYKKDLILKKGE